MYYTHTMLIIVIILVIIVIIIIIIVIILVIIVIIVITIIIVILIVIIMIIPWLRTHGVNAHGAAAKVMNFDGLGKKVRPGTFGKTKVG